MTAGRRSRVAIGWAAGIALAMAAACGDSGSSAPEGQPAPSTTATTVPTTTTAPTTTAPTTIVPTTTVPKGRTVALGETFSVKVGESATIAGAGLTVTFTSVVSDSRCPPGVQCIQAGNAVVAVTVTRPGTGPVKLTLDTGGPTSARVGTRAIELITLSRGQAPIAQLKVT